MKYKLNSRALLSHQPQLLFERFRVIKAASTNRGRLFNGGDFLTRAGANLCMRESFFAHKKSPWGRIYSSPRRIFDGGGFLA